MSTEERVAIIVGIVFAAWVIWILISDRIDRHFEKVNQEIHNRRVRNKALYSITSPPEAHHGQAE